MSNTDLYIIIGGTIAAIILTYLKEKHNLINSESQKEYPRGSENRRKRTAQKSQNPKDGPK
jgi:hypothetical protein